MVISWRRIALTAVIVIVGFAFVFIPIALTRGEYEGPQYRVVRQDDKIEVREYQGYIVARVEVASDYNSAMNSGFMKLFNYISGRNTNRSRIKMTVPVTEEQVSAPEKIPMTAPVTSEKMKWEAYRVSFIMPANYTLDTLPVPDDKSITFKKVEPYTAAVITFSGRMKEELANKKIEELKDWLRKNNLEQKSNFITAQYDPPWIPGFMRRNEIIAEI